MKMDSINFTLWKEVIKKHLGPRCVKKYVSILYDMLVVDIGFKQSFLLDYTSLTLESTKDFLDELKSEKLVADDMCVISVDSDVLICKKCLIEQILDKRFTHRVLNSVTFVNVSAVAGRPNRMKIDMIIPSVQAIEEMELVMENSYRVNLHSWCNVTTIFGLLLGYPIVYWYNVSDGEESRNCLGNEPLMNCKVIGMIPDTRLTEAGPNFRGRGTTIFPDRTFNSRVEMTSLHDGHHLRSYNLPDERSMHLIFSFSVPALMYMGPLRQLLTKWMRDLGKTPWKSLFSDLHYSEELTVIMHQVAL